jgi:arsenate reductase (glutaredoxin)
MIVIYGLRNCDSCRKARALVAAAGVAHRFHDLRLDGPPPAGLASWIATAGWEALLNRRGTTWRALPEAERADVDAAAAARLMARYPALIKRPVIEAGDILIVGLARPQQAALEAALAAQSGA